MEEKIVYAVNLVAFMNTAKSIDLLPLWLLFKDIVTKQIVRPYPTKMGHDAVLVRSDVSKERWCAVVQIVRTKLNKNEFLLYTRARGRWGKV
jgi:hypothetical protein